MAQQDFQCTITVDSTPAKALEDISRVGDWWARDFKGSAQKPGDVFTVRFGETFVTFQISDFVPDTRIVWNVTDCYLHWLSDKTEWKGTKAVWELSAKGANTQITFTHIGLTPEVECYNDCKTGWTGHVTDSLFKLITTGKGTPR